MSIKDKVRNLIGRHGDKVDKAIDKAGDIADRKTKGKYSDRIDSAQSEAKKAVDRMGQEQERER
jgi:uncharacterized protein YjbJ (UPF0337 family)